MQRVRIKSGDSWQEKDFSGPDLGEWFKDHTKDGQVTEEIVLFTDAIFKSEGDGVSWVMSDMSLDRDLERVDPNGADMKQYKRNPVVLWAHDTRTPAIGKVMNPKIKDGQVVGKIQFDTAENDPFAGMIAGKVKAGIIQAGSIGFKPTKVEFVENEKDPTKLIHRGWELMEFSICNVPANANALAAQAEPEEEKDWKSEIDSLRASITEVKNIVVGGKYSRLMNDGAIEEMFPARSETSAANNQDSVLDGLFTQGEHHGA